MNEKRYIIGIGAQKSGTSWLADYLSNHPKVLVPPYKELHFFDSIYQAQPQLCGGLERKVLNTFIELAHKIRANDIVNQTPRFKRFMKLAERARICGDIERYRDYFAFYAKNNESIFCEVTPEYSLLTADGYRAIKGLADDVRLVFLIRNPVDRFWSAVRMWAKSHPDYDVPANFEIFLNRQHYFLSTDYGNTLKTVYEVFPKERVFVQFYEHLFNSDVIEQLCQFCDIEFIAPDTEKRVLEGIPLPLTPEMRKRIYQQFAHVYQWAETEFNSALPKSWLADIKAFQ
ncbi:MAG: sulfotransferase [Methylococcaceae bacterium]